MNNGPFAVFPHPYGNRLHCAAAVGGAVTRLEIQMLAGETIWTMVPVFAPRAVGDDILPHILQTKVSLHGCVL